MKSFKFLMSLAFILLIAGNLQAAVSFTWNGPTAPANGDTISVNIADYEVALHAATYSADGSEATYNGNTYATYSAADILNRKISGGLITGVGDELYGIFKVNSILNQNGDTLWTAIGNQQLEGVFSGFTALNSISGPAPFDVAFSGGNIQMYFSGNDPNAFTANPGPFKAGWAGIDVSNNVGDANDVLVLSATGVGGIAASPTTTLASTFNTNTATSFTGVGDGFLTVTLDSIFGVIADGMDTDPPTFSSPYPGLQDLKFKSNFTGDPAGVSSQVTPGWSITSQDPINAQIDPLPEASSFLIWGGLLAGACVVRRRRKTA